MADRTRLLHLLVAEDNEDDVLLIREAIAEDKLPCTYDVVRDGVEALQFLRRQGRFKDARRPNLVLLDINMPRKGGFETLQEMKADPELKHHPVVMLTTSDAAIDVIRSYSLGASSYVTKPADFAVFREVIKHMVLYWTVVSRVPGHAARE